MNVCNDVRPNVREASSIEGESWLNADSLARTACGI